jgi:tetratricopeptide (TPR) repeat protein
VEISRLQSQIDFIKSKTFSEPDLAPGVPSQVVPFSELTLTDLYQLLQLDPYSTSAALELGRRLRRSGHTVEAVQVFESLCHIDNGFATLFELGLAYYQNDQMDPSLRSLQQAVLVSAEEDPDLMEVFKTIGNIFVRIGDFDSAEDAYNKAIRLQPESATLMVNLGTLEIQRSAWEKATERFRDALRLQSANDKAWVGLALCHRHRGDLELSWANLDTALSWNPCNDTALHLAVDWASTDQREGHLLKLLRQFLLAGGWNIKLSLIFAWLSWSRGDRFSANIELERVLTTDPSCESGWNLRNKMRASA